MRLYKDIVTQIFQNGPLPILYAWYERILIMMSIFSMSAMKMVTKFSQQKR